MGRPTVRTCCLPCIRETKHTHAQHVGDGQAQGCRSKEDCDGLCLALSFWDAPKKPKNEFEKNEMKKKLIDGCSPEVESATFHAVLTNMFPDCKMDIECTRHDKNYHLCIKEKKLEGDFKDVMGAATWLRRVISGKIDDATSDIVIKIAAATNGNASDVATTWADAVDITSSFLASGNSVQLGPSLKDTVISMYKGDHTLNHGRQ